ncbi:MAG TPA: hypothetical protein VMU50_02305 [Polyangia bacterium]|nr:hypothetical protein [Polyangia bacterium]
MAFFVQTTSGCLSNQYTIQRDELKRLASVPPDVRGQGVRLSQNIGDRRSDAIDPEPPPPPAVVEDQPPEPDVAIQIEDGGGSGGGRGVRRGPRDLPGARSGGGWRGSPAGGGHAAPRVGGGTFRGTPAGHGGGSMSVPSGGGKDSAAELLVVIAVLAIVAATAGTIGLVASEGVRFDGHAEVAPAQLLYLRTGSREEVVALGDLTPAQAARADDAVVKDDEGYGLRRLDRAPLDRTGGVFRLELGAGLFTVGDTLASGLSAHIQGGVYLTPTFGLVLDLGLGSGTIDPCCAGALAASGTLARHSISLEAQSLPLRLGPLHLGGFAGGGFALARADGLDASGPVASAGALIELDLTSHMALVVRAGASRAWLGDQTSSTGTLTAGVAIY